jgi:hypothetical protein
LSSVNIITSVSSIDSIEAVLFSSFKRAISQNMSPEWSSATFCHLITTFTFHDFIIYHSQFDLLHSRSIISLDLKVFSGAAKIISSTVFLSIHLNISKFSILSDIFKLLFTKVNYILTLIYF